MRASRERRHDPYLEWKVRVFSVAAVLALAGMYMEERWMTGLALVLLGGAMVVRLVARRRAESLSGESGFEDADFDDADDANAGHANVDHENVDHGSAADGGAADESAADENTGDENTGDEDTGDEDPDSAAR